MTAGQGGDQRQQPVEAGGQVHVHVRDDVRVAGAPDGAQGEPAALAVEVDDADARQFVGEATGGGEGLVGAGVVGDRDPPGEGEVRRQSGVECAQAAGQGAFLVVDRNDDVDRRGTGLCMKGPLDLLERGQALRAGSGLGEMGGGSHGFLRREGTADCGSEAQVRAAASLLPPRLWRRGKNAEN